MNRDAGREPHPILALAVETSVDPIQLPANGHRPEDFVIESTPNCIRERSIRVGNAVAAADMADAHQKLREGTEALDLNRNSRAKQSVVLGDVRAGAAEIVAAVMPIDICDQANPGQELSFKRCLPSVQVGGVAGRNRSALI